MLLLEILSRTYTICGVPALYWFILYACHLYHIVNEAKKDAEETKVAFTKTFTGLKLVGVVSNAFITGVLLIVGWDGYMSAVAKHPDIDFDKAIAICVAAIGYGGSSLFMTIVPLIFTGIQNFVAGKVGVKPPPSDEEKHD